MARPKDPIYVWAAADVNLPGTGRPNKSKPIDDLLAKGYDKGQKPAAEEFNYILNMSSGWIDWIVNEKFPELEAEIARLLAELENRINQQLDVIRQDIAKLQQDVADLRRYVDQKVSELKQEIQGVRNDLNKLRQDFDAAIAQVNGRIDELEPRLVPIGAIIPWPGRTPPNGWLECNGQVFNTGKNPKLYSVLGRNVVPDYRGLFLRGWAHGSGAYDPDYNRGLGSVQSATNLNHYHHVGRFTANGGSGGDDISFPVRGQDWRGENYSSRKTYGDKQIAGRGSVPNGLGGQTVSTSDPVMWDNVSLMPFPHPHNVAVMYIIKTDQAESSGSNSPTGIVVSPDSVTNRVGYTVKATASVLPSSIAGQYPVTWATQNNDVATVDGSGNIRLVGPGETNIIASISTGMNVQIRVTSYSVLTSISIADPGDIPVNDSKMLVVTKNPGSANEPLQYLSNNAGVATVNDAGYVTGVSPGSATITVRGTLSGVSATRSVTIVPEVVTPVLEDIKLGVQQRGDPLQAPPGCVVTYVRQAESAEYIQYKALLKQVNGEWVIVEG